MRSCSEDSQFIGCVSPCWSSGREAGSFNYHHPTETQGLSSGSSSLPITTPLFYMAENQGPVCANNGLNEPYFSSAASVLLTGLPCCLILSQSFLCALPLFKEHLTIGEYVYVCKREREIEIKGGREGERKRERERERERERDKKIKKTTGNR